MSLDQVRAVADAVLFEGYLLYPYRASSAKNQSRWQFGVLGPPGAAGAGIGEESGMSMQCLLEPVGVTGGTTPGTGGTVTVHLRFLQLQTRTVERLDGQDHVRVAELEVDGRTLLSWDEAVEREVTLPVYPVVTDGASGAPPSETTIDVPGGEDVEDVVDGAGTTLGRIVRRRWPLVATVGLRADGDGALTRLSVAVENAHPDVARDKIAAIRTSLIGAHVVVHADGACFVSLLEPPADAAEAAAACQQRRCWPVLAGSPGSTDVVLGSPIILYDYPEVAAESAGALFDSTEIDEILTLRVMTMTEGEKAEARATDPRAAQIIDRCDQMSPDSLQQLHGVLRDPHALDPHALDQHALDARVDVFSDVRDVEPATFDTGDVPWWDPATDSSVQPEVDSVLINGVSVAKGSLVRVHPSRRADAQDLFFAGQVARVTAVLSDVDGDTHVALVLVDDPAADLHEWYGRYLYFAPDELEPLDGPLPELRGEPSCGSSE